MSTNLTLHSAQKPLTSANVWVTQGQEVGYKNKLTFSKVKRCLLVRLISGGFTAQHIFSIPREKSPKVDQSWNVESFEIFFGMKYLNSSVLRFTSMLGHIHLMFCQITKPVKYL